jgi:nucleoside-diphosphate-sugar epimerase
MSSAAEPVKHAVRSRRSAGPVVAVTGAASGLGLASARALAADPAVGKVIGIDTRRGHVDGATWRVHDVCDPGIAARLGAVDTVVHLALDLGVEANGHGGHGGNGLASRNVRGTQTVLTAAAAAGVRRVVLCTSAMVYGALPQNPVPLDEDAPLHAVPDGALIGDLIEIERLADQAPRTHRGLQVTVLRPAAVVGPGIDSVLTRHFEAPRLLVVRGTTPKWQFCHVDDLADAVVSAALGRVSGVVTVGCDGWLEQSEVETITGMRRIELPSSVALATAGRLHRLGVIPAPASDLHYVMHPWVVPSTKLREAGWRPTYDNPTALGVLLEQVSGHHALAARRVGRRDATIGAAGAAVAVVGTAALVRRARKKRRG